jgi:hypothetical protein
MRDTAFVEFLISGGLTHRQAVCVERWLEDKRPAGVGPVHLLNVVQRARDAELCRMDQEQAILRDTIAEMEGLLFVGRSALISRD